MVILSHRKLWYVITYPYPNPTLTVSVKDAAVIDRLKKQLPIWCRWCPGFEAIDLPLEIWLVTWLTVTSFKRHGISDYQQIDYLLISLSMQDNNSSKKLKLHITSSLCGDIQVTDVVPLRRTSDEESVSMSWRHDGLNIHYVEIIPTTSISGPAFYIFWKCILISDGYCFYVIDTHASF